MSEDKATTFVPSKFRVLHSWRSTGKGEGEKSTELFPDHAEWRALELAHSARRGKWACLKGPSNNKHPLSMSPASFESFGKIMTLSSQPCGVTMLPGVSQNLLSSPLWGCSLMAMPRKISVDSHTEHKRSRGQKSALWTQPSIPLMFPPKSTSGNNGVQGRVLYLVLTEFL